MVNDSGWVTPSHAAEGVTGAHLGCTRKGCPFKGGLAWDWRVKFDVLQNGRFMVHWI